MKYLWVTPVVGASRTIIFHPKTVNITFVLPHHPSSTAVDFINLPQNTKLSLPTLHPGLPLRAFIFHAWDGYLLLSFVKHFTSLWILKFGSPLVEDVISELLLTSMGSLSAPWRVEDNNAMNISSLSGFHFLCIEKISALGNETSC